MRRLTLYLTSGLLTFTLGSVLPAIWEVSGIFVNQFHKNMLTADKPLVCATGMFMEQDDIVETVFRYQTQKYKANVYFLSLQNGTDPAKEFMDRFAGDNQVVRRVSQSTFGNSYFVMDLITRERGAALYAGQVKWMGDDEVEVYGMISTGRESSRGYTYNLGRAGNGWMVISEQAVSE